MRGSENTIGVAIMSRQNRINPSDPGAQADRPSTKRPYQKPAFRHERVFETRALVCGKIKDRKSTRLNSSHLVISYAVFCLKKKKKPVDLLHPCGAYLA